VTNRFFKANTAYYLCDAYFNWRFNHVFAALWYTWYV